MTDFKPSPPRGMRDFYPDEYRARETLFDAWRQTASLWGFEMFDAPVVESLELLERKAGEEISDQIYAFEDKGGNRLALRPELTPSLARMIIARQGGLSFPLKWSAIVQCFRYERMQRGRKREHYQWNLDIIGESSVMAEAEVIGAAVNALRTMGLTANDFKVRIGSRSFLFSWMRKEGYTDEQIVRRLAIIDKRGKLSDKEVNDLLQAEQSKDNQKIMFTEFLFQLLDLRDEDGLRQLRKDRDSESISDEYIAAFNEIESLFALSEKLGFREFLTLDLGIVRGLGYYTGIVFEAFDTAGKFRAIFGGGRYDNLLSSLGGEMMPSVGLGFGDVVVMELLADLNKSPQSERTVEYAVGFMDEASRSLAFQIASALRGAGHPCDLALRPEKPKKFFDRANRIGAGQAIYIGPDEAASGKFAIKPMRGGEPRETNLTSLIGPG